MKAIILAAGSGTRMGRYTKNIPKGMLKLAGHTIIEWQIKILKNNGIKDIIIVTGYKKEKINYPDITYFNNSNYATTNMIETFMCAEKELHSDLILSYSDIIFSKELLKKMIEKKGDILVAADKDWRKYWLMRYCTTETDLETFTVSSKGEITEIGKLVTSSKGLKYRYIGLLKLSKTGIRQFKEYYYKKKLKNENWRQSGNVFSKGYITDILSELIQENIKIQALATKGGWIEFDQPEDYELAKKLYKTGKLPILR